MFKIGKGNEKKRVGFFLTAGGSRAAFQFGAIKELKRRDIVPDKIWGVSGGGINAAILGTLNYKLLEYLWDNLKTDWIYNGNPLLRLLGFKPSLYSLDPLERTLNELLKYQTFEIPVSCVSISANDGSPKAFHHSDDNFIRGVRASSSIPGVFDPVEIDGEYYVDGGVRDYAPLSYMIRDEIDYDLVVLISTKSRTDSTVKDFGKYVRIWEIMTSSFPIMMEEMFQSDLRKFETINRLVEQANKKGIKLYSESGREYKNYDYLYIEPDEDLGSALDFSSSNISYMINKGIDKVKSLP